MSDSSNYPVIDDAYVRRVFDLLSNMDVELDPDPIAFGPKRLNGKVAQCRDYLSKCQRIYLQLANDLGQLNRAHRQSKLDFDLRMQDLFANDPDVRSGKNVRDREAVATMKLRDEREMTTRLESSIQDLDAVLTVVKAKREDLKDVQGRIRDQVKLCQEEIGLGERWGSAPSPGTRMSFDNRPRVDTAALEAMHDTMGDLEGDTSISDLDKFVALEMVAQGRASEIDSPEVLLPAEDSEEVPFVVEAALTSVLKVIAQIEPLVKPDEFAARDMSAFAEVTKKIDPPVKEDVPDEDDLDSLFGDITSAPVAVTPAMSILPEVAIVAPPKGSAVSDGDLDSFLDDLDVTPRAAGKIAAVRTPPPVAEVNIDDILNGFDDS